MSNVVNLPPINILLEPREDRRNNIIHVGRLRGPTTLKFKKGVAFLVYLEEDGQEELHIACPKAGSECLPIRRRLNEDGTVDRYVISLDKRQSRSTGGTFYAGMCHDDNLELDLEDGYIFFIFSAVAGKEELHITKNKEQPFRERSERPVTEVISRDGTRHVSSNYRRHTDSDRPEAY